MHELSSSTMWRSPRLARVSPELKKCAYESMMRLTEHRAMTSKESAADIENVDICSMIDSNYDLLMASVGIISEIMCLSMNRALMARLSGSCL